MFGPEDFAAACHVSRETMAKLERYGALLEDWNTRHNLVAESTLADRWHRHFFDSAQLAPLIPQDAKTLADIGSGAGFPGLVLAILLEGRVHVSLFEATAKKCAFLRAVADDLGLDIAIRQERVEATPKQVFDVVTARACAPLAKLLGYAQHFAGKHSRLLFLKGEGVDGELTEAGKFWRMKLERHPSRTHEKSVILEIVQLKSASSGVRR